MAAFVLVHGASHGGWCWKKLSPLLRVGGHEVYTPTLTGLGERAHLATPDVGLDTHIQDVVAVLEYEDLRDVVLVGHSLGGMVITGVANAAPGRLAHLVYLDAIVPQHGESRWDSMSPAHRARLESQLRATGDGWRVGAASATPLSDRQHIAATTTAIGATPEDAERQWVRARLVSHPLRAFRDPVRFDNPAALALARTYIYCTQKPADDAITGVRAASIQRARTEPGWRYRELATGHAAMITAPHELADLLLEAAQR